MSNFIEGINEGISKNQLEGTVTDLKRALDNELAALRVDRRDLAGKTVKSAHKEWAEIILIFDDGTYFIVEAENDYSDGITLFHPNMDIENARRLDLLADGVFQPLDDAKKATSVLDDEKEGVTNLNNAIAHLGIDAVKKLVNNV